MFIKPEYKIIADHLRSSCFLIADGILPSNEGRGYVLRRIMRRGMRQIHKLNGAQALMYKFVPSLIKEMSTAYPELLTAQDLIVDTLKNEEEKFRTTLISGLKILEEELTKKSNGKFSGQIAFKLYDTYGFPLDLTEDIIKERKLTVDLKEFESEMAKQKTRAKESWSGSGEIQQDDIFFKLAQKYDQTRFSGYDATKSEAKIVAILKENQEVSSATQNDRNIAIILDQSPFYATSGGQKGDDGKIILSTDYKENNNIEDLKNFIQIAETKKISGNLYLHLTSEVKGNFKIGDTITAIVNKESRQSKARNHSATHLLHKALKEVLGNQITQKGSNVDSEDFTFDFNSNNGLTLQELDQVENLVNFYIRQNSSVNTKIMSITQAKESGAMALFGEKYEDEVRVLSMGKNNDEQDWSVELCGGTHVKATGDIGLLKIISEKGIASGIRRIEAKTGDFAFKYMLLQERKLQEANEQLIADLKQKDKEIERLKKQLLLADLSGFKKEKTNSSINLIHYIFKNIDAKELREVTVELTKRKEFTTNSLFAFFSEANEKITAVIAISADLTNSLDAGNLIKPVIEIIGGKGGGGNKTLAMGGGTDAVAINKAILHLKTI